MKRVLVLSVLVLFLGSARANAQRDVYKSIYNGIDMNLMWANLRMMTGYDPITIGGETFTIPKRDTPTDKKHFREFFINYVQKLGLQAQEISYSDDPNGPITGVHVEAVLEGKSKDSVICISHYDSAGDKDNHAVDDAASGIAIMLEAARLLTPLRGHLEHTVRFVVADGEEGYGGPDSYGKYISSLMTSRNFAVVGSVDFDQMGWVSPDNDGTKYNLYVRDPVKAKILIDAATEVTSKYSHLKMVITDLGRSVVDADFLEDYGIYGITPAELDDPMNPYKDNSGDNLDKISPRYYLKMARLGATILAKVTGITP